MTSLRFAPLVLLLVGCGFTDVTAPASDSSKRSPEATPGFDADPGDSLPTLPPRTDTPVTSIALGGETLPVYGHPRIWITPASLEELRDRATAANPMWVGLEYAVDTSLGNGSYATSADAGTLLDFAIAYLATGDTAYRSAARTMLLNFTNPARYDVSCDGSVYCGNDNIDYGSIDLMYLAAAFDWLYPDLDAADRSAVIDWVYGTLIPFLRKHPYTGDPVHNLGHTKWCGEFLWAVATLGADPRALDLIEETYLFWRDEILPLLDEVFPGGHTYSGSGYGYNRVFKYQLYAFEAAYTAFGLDMYSRHPWPIDEALYRIHATLPVDGLFASDWESAEATYNQGRMNENEALLANRYRGSALGKAAQYFLENDFRPRAYSNQGGVRINPIYVGRWFLWYDDTLPSEDYALTRSTAYVADGLGAFMSRTAWHDEKATWVTMSAARYVGDHQLHNEGSFKIFRKEYLVVENGRYYSGQNSNLTPTDTNILFVGNGAVDYGNVTGGLYRREAGSRARFDRFVSNDAAGLAYARADLTTAYKPAFHPLDDFKRSLVHLKAADTAAPDHLVLFDRVVSRRAERKKAYVHLAETPTVSGDTASMLSTRGVSRLRVVNLLPETTTMSVEAVTDKTAGLIQEGSDQPSRLVLSKTADAKTDLFLSTFTVADGGAASLPSVGRVESADGSRIGAQIADPALGWVVLFSADGRAPTAAFSYRVPKNGRTQHALFDLAPGGKYDISITGDGERNVTVTPNGSGSFEANDQGGLIFADP